jgi:hypothetical protein
MAEDPHEPDLVELTRRSMGATNEGSFDSSLMFAPDAVFDVSSQRAEPTGGGAPLP